MNHTIVSTSDTINCNNSKETSTSNPMVDCPGKFLQAPANAQHLFYSTSAAAEIRDTRRFKLLSLSDLSRRRASQACDD
jgi:hypothetical protein